MRRGLLRRWLLIGAAALALSPALGGAAPPASTTPASVAATTSDTPPATVISDRRGFAAVVVSTYAPPRLTPCRLTRRGLECVGLDTGPSRPCVGRGAQVLVQPRHGRAYIPRRCARRRSPRLPRLRSDGSSAWRVQGYDCRMVIDTDSLRCVAPGGYGFVRDVSGGSLRGTKIFGRRPDGRRGPAWEIPPHNRIHTPTGNIACYAGGGYIRCDIRSHSAPMPEPCVGEGDSGFAVSMATRGRPRHACVTDAVVPEGGSIRLEYGATWHYGLISCTSERIGLTCRNHDGHGWFLSRERIHFF